MRLREIILLLRMIPDLGIGYTLHAGFSRKFVRIKRGLGSLIGWSQQAEFSLRFAQEKSAEVRPRAVFTEVFAQHPNHLALQGFGVDWLEPDRVPTAGDGWRVIREVIPDLAGVFDDLQVGVATGSDGDAHTPVVFDKSLLTVESLECQLERIVVERSVRGVDKVWRVNAKRDEEGLTRGSVVPQRFSGSRFGAGDAQQAQSEQLGDAFVEFSRGNLELNGDFANGALLGHERSEPAALGAIREQRASGLILQREPMSSLLFH